MRRVSMVLAISLALAACTKRAVDDHEKRISELQSENGALKARVSELEKKLAEVGVAQPEPARTRPEATGSKEPFLRVEDSPAYRNLSANLAQSNQELNDARTKLRALEEQIAVTTEENQKLGNSQRDLQAQLTQASDQLDALRKDLAARDQRVQQAEETARKLKADTSAATQKNSQLLKAFDELEDIQRRREATATNIYGRYRDLNEFLRSLSLTLQSSNEGSAQTDLSRIQQMISMADEDMRQLRSLNAQAARANKKLASLKP